MKRLVALISVVLAAALEADAGVALSNARSSHSFKPVLYDFTLPINDPRYPMPSLSVGVLTEAVIQKCAVDGYYENDAGQKTPESHRRELAAQKLAQILHPETTAMASAGPPGKIVPVPMLADGHDRIFLVLDSFGCLIERVGDELNLIRRIHLNQPDLLQAAWLTGRDSPRLLLRMGKNISGQMAGILIFSWKQLLEGGEPIRLGGGDRIEFVSLQPLALHLHFSRNTFLGNYCEYFGRQLEIVRGVWDESVKAICKDEPISYHWWIRERGSRLTSRPDPMPESWRRELPVENNKLLRVQESIPSMIGPARQTYDFHADTDKQFRPLPPAWLTATSLGECMWRLRMEQFPTSETDFSKDPLPYQLLGLSRLQRQNKYMTWIPVPGRVYSTDDAGLAFIPDYGVCLFGTSGKSSKLLSYSWTRFTEAGWAVWERAASPNLRWLVMGLGDGCNICYGDLTVFQVNLRTAKLIETVPSGGSGALEAWNYKVSEKGSIVYVHSSWASGRSSYLCHMSDDGFLAEKAEELGRPLTEEETAKVTSGCEDMDAEAEREAISYPEIYSLVNGYLIPVKQKDGHVGTRP